MVALLRGIPKIIDAMVDAAANIAVSKLAAGTKGYAVLSDASGARYDVMPRRNIIVNGSCRVAQRGTNLLASDNAEVSTDKFRVVYSTGTGPTMRTDNVSVSTPADASGYTSILLSGGNQKFGWFYPISNRNMFRLRSQKCSAAVNIQQGGAGAITDTRWGILYRTGTADAISGDPINDWGSGNAGITSFNDGWTFIAAPSNLGLTNNIWSRAKLEDFTVPAGATNLGILIWCDDTTHTISADYLAINDLQFERGSVCTPFENIPYEQELILCGAAGTAGLLHSSSAGVPSYSPVATADISDGAITSAKILDGTIATGDLAANAITQLAQKTVVSYNDTTNNASFVTMKGDNSGEDMSVTLTTAGGDILALFSGVIHNNTVGGLNAIGFSLDGADTTDLMAYTAYAVNAYGSHTIVYRWAAPAAGSHTIRVRWRAASGTAGAYGRQLIIMEIKR